MTQMKFIVIFLTLICTTLLNAQVKISGTAKNYVDTIFYIQEPGGFDNFTRAWRDNMIKVRISKSGYFSTTIPEQAINTWYVKTEKGNQFFDLIKGKHIRLIADFAQSTPLKAIGDNADDFNYLSSYAKDSIDTYYEKNLFLSKNSIKNIDSALFYRKAFSQYQIELLKKYRQTHRLSDVYCKWLYSKYIYQPYERAIVEDLDNKDSLSETTLLKIIEKSINDEYAALNNSDYNDIIGFYMFAKYMKQKTGDFSANAYFDFSTNSDLIKGNTKNVFLSRLMYWMRTIPDSLYSPAFEKYDRIVSNKKMKQSIIKAREDYNSSTKTYFSRAKTIEEIFGKYKGKVMYVDFWASWCVPCRAEMPNAKALKNMLKGKNIIFLYLGYKDKEKAWIKARNQLDIEGEHYLLTESMVKEADEIFGINGIPHYAIIDKKGNIVSKLAGKPDEVHKQLLTEIDK